MVHLAHINTKALAISAASAGVVAAAAGVTGGMGSDRMDGANRLAAVALLPLAAGILFAHGAQVGAKRAGTEIAKHVDANRLRAGIALGGAAGIMGAAFVTAAVGAAQGTSAWRIEAPGVLSNRSKYEALTQG